MPPVSGDFHLISLNATHSICGRLGPVSLQNDLAQFRKGVTLKVFAMLPLQSLFDNRSWSLLHEFDEKRELAHVLDMKTKVRKSIYVTEEIIRGAQHRGLSLADYIAHLHANQRSIRVAYVASVYRGFALLEMARVPVDPAYFDLVYGVLGDEDGTNFRKLAASGKEHALPQAAARLLGADTRSAAVEAIFMAASRASVMHEGYIEAARLLEATIYR